MRIVVGLGNPGRRYQGTRHNIGFAVADEVARRGQAEFECGRGETLTARVGRGPAALLVVKPLTMMNLSGEAVAAVAGFYKVDPPAMLVAADDVNLPLGRLRLRAAGHGRGAQRVRSRSSGAWARRSSRGCGWASDAATPGATSRITCWRCSMTTSGTRWIERLPGLPTRWRRSSRRASRRP